MVLRPPNPVDIHEQQLRHFKFDDRHIAPVHPEEVKVDSKLQNFLRRSPSLYEEFQKGTHPVDVECIEICDERVILV
ncbi:uncharacterized protein E5676_scaffold2376G00100 [Cucumis melo var. makuwa]|uniref:Uncharacterized protein n=1 Tax=Cucumis melo var. makuwa TaxID=1194695 RepID=A0A5A7U7H7_CUCMM|nr:uncharacterized protein E6C27_scaffold60G00870 [Cucumis melo var. makuwa]TYK31608.1 uncharacterized protein E5676_scaffold2376G00100 [Cucumis melo var. makuwa]